MKLLSLVFITVILSAFTVQPKPNQKSTGKVLIAYAINGSTVIKVAREITYPSFDVDTLIGITKLPLQEFPTGKQLVIDRYGSDYDLIQPGTNKIDRLSDVKIINKSVPKIRR